MNAASGAAPLDVFYPIVPDAAWLARLVPLGVRTIQLRLKDLQADGIRNQIAASLDVCRRHGCQLIVNDFWREAIDAGANYVHLGQEDLRGADLAVLRRHGVSYGISTHDHAELGIALAAEPAYVALGPIWETKLKEMKFGPQGLDRIAEWNKLISPLPLVAIGGITLERAGIAIDAGAQAASAITDFLSHPDPEGRVGAWLNWAARHRIRS